MPRQPIKKILCFVLASALLISYQEKASAQKPDHVAGDVMVMMKHGMDVTDLARDFTMFDNVSSGIAIVQQLSKRLNIWLIHFDATAVDETKFLSGIQKSPQVLLAQFNHYVESRNTPNDPDFGQQWNMLNIGQTGGLNGADVRATNAWDITTGGLTASGDTIVLAIDDDGFDLLHEDLHYWKNHEEIPGDGMDNDNNGYIDDYDGWNAQTGNGTIISSSHGTHVAGIAGAIGNNGKGVAGVNWNVQIMPVQGNSGTEAIAVAGYSYILEMRAKYNETDGTSGAFVVATNSSWGIDFALPANFPIWAAMYDSMGYYGILSAAATNNSSNVNVDVQGDMPTACPSDYLISVTNTNNNDLRTAAYGLTTIDLGAPGTSILSTVPGNLYQLKTGTSMASPHVAGAVALICSLPCEGLSNDLKNDPAGTALKIKNFILDATDPVSNMTGFSVTGGRLNVYQALLNAAAYYDCNVGIDEATVAGNNFWTYPNPATDELTVLLKNDSYKIKTVSLLNLLGQKLFDETFSDPSGHIFHLNVSSFQKGMYLLKIETGNGLVFSKKILID